VPRLKSIKKMRGRGSVPLPIHPRVTYAAHLIRRWFRGHNKSSVKARMPDDYEGSTCLSLSSPLYLSLPFVFHVARETRNDRRGHSSSSLLWPRLYLHWWITFFLAEYLCARFCGPALSSALVALLLIFHPLLGSITSWGDRWPPFAHQTKQGKRERPGGRRPTLHASNKTRRPKCALRVQGRPEFW
jgi:hypothetical protein